jgi:hypothetical protein
MFRHKPGGWEDCENNILWFCSLLSAWTPSAEAREFLLSVQRGYNRVGLVGAAKDAWTALGAACLWRACCFPDHIQFVLVDSPESGQAWIRFLKKMAAGSVSAVREQLLFSKDGSMIVMRHADEPAITVLDPAHLWGTTRVLNSRPTTLVMPDFNRVPTSWFPALKHLVSTEKDQWLAVSPTFP